MKIHITAEAESDLVDGFWFYESQAPHLGSYFRSCLISDIDSLVFYAGTHEIAFGFYRALSKRFPFAIYYQMESKTVIVIAVLDCRRQPSWIRQRLDEQ
ncbi:MAG: type II toxin-antitoxin system RelE/ParE family toxin [Rubripirellula sp.]